MLTEEQQFNLQMRATVRFTEVDAPSPPLKSHYADWSAKSDADAFAMPTLDE
jgi:hypothetical protein